MQTTSKVTCPIEGFEQVVITYNVMASQADFEAWTSSMGVERQEAVIAEVEGWPSEKYGEPFGQGAPWGFRLWACKPGLKLAFEGFLATPHSSTPSMASTPLSGAAASSPRPKSTRR